MTTILVLSFAGLLQTLISNFFHFTAQNSNISDIKFGLETKYILKIWEELVSVVNVCVQLD